MFTSDPAKQISALGEVRLIEAIREWLGPVSPPAPNGIGDDCAVIGFPSDCQLLQTTDSLSYGLHFDDSASAAEAGAKLIKRNLSDIAAMGGEPTVALLSLLCAPNLETRWLEDFFSGIRQSCLDYSVQLVGGDISGLPTGQFTAVLSLSGTVQQAKLRSNTAIGDHIYVTGALGGSLKGKHLDFEPRLREGRWLKLQAEVNSLMDITDGLAKDLLSILDENQAASLLLDTIPITQDAVMLSNESGKPALEHAFCDGEDYELLFTLQKDANPIAFEVEWAKQFPTLPCTRIGSVVRSTHGTQLFNEQDETPALDARL